MFCSKCGYELKADAVFCSRCGERVAESSKSDRLQKKVITNKCESCGSELKQLSPKQYICEYCGSEYYTNNNKEIEDCKITEKKLLDLFYEAAQYERNNKSWDELQCLLGVMDEAYDNVVYLVKLGRAYRRNNMFAKALECYEKAMQINQEYAPIYSNIGAVYILTEQYEKAEAPCKKAIELMNISRVDYTQSDYAIAHSNLAISVGKLGRKKEAKEYLAIAEKNGYKNGAAARKMIGIKKWPF